MKNKDIYQMIAEIREIAIKVKIEVEDAHERINGLNKWLYALGSSILITIIGLILNLIFTN